MWRRYAEGIDEVDLLCAALPTPLLLMAGAYDEVFHIDDTRRLAEEVGAFYREAGQSDRFAFFVDQAGHCYSLVQARQFVRFTNRWLLGKPERPVSDLTGADFSLDSYDQVRCFPRPDVNMRSLALDRANELEAARKPNDCAGSKEADRVRAAAWAISNCGQVPDSPSATVGEPFQIWTHYWQQLLLHTEAGIELPATFVYPCEGVASALLHLDDRRRNRLLYRDGLLAQTIRFLDRQREGGAVLTVDLRGWGDSQPAMYPYEMAAWGSTDRCLAYASAALGDPVMSMRIRDALTALAYLRSLPQVSPHRIFVSGCGLGALVALHVAAIDTEIAGSVLWDSLVSFKALLQENAYAWSADAFVPNVLLHYDLTDLVRAAAGPVHILGPLDGKGLPLSRCALGELNESLPYEAYETYTEPGQVVSAVQKLLFG